MIDIINPSILLGLRDFFVSKLHSLFPSSTHEMTITAPGATRALRGLKQTLPLCPRTGRVQPCLPLAIACAFDVRVNLSASRILVRHAHHSKDAPNQYQVARSHEDKIAKRINPPASTLPPPLDFPERQPDQSTPGYWWKVGKAFWAFYKQGSKNIYANRNAAKEIRAKLAASTSQDVPTNDATKPGSSSAPLAGTKQKMLETVTRSETQLLRRSKSEMRRVPIFAVILAVFGEWTPLLVMFATPIVPYNCRIPRQIRKSREKSEVRRKESFRGDCKSLAESNRGQPYVPSPQDVTGARSTEGADLPLSDNATLHICRSLNLYPAWMDTLVGLHPIGPTILLASMRLSPRLSKHIRGYLNDDDVRLLRDSAGIKPFEIPSRLSDEEVLVAAEERGIDILGRAVRDVRQDLGLWLDISRKRVETRAKKFDDIEPLLRMMLSRSNQWESIRQEMSRPDHGDEAVPKLSAGASV